MIRQALVFMVLLLLSGCSMSNKSIHTEFSTPFCIKPYHDYHYQTCKKIRFIVNDREFEITENFDTDLASIPGIAWFIMAPSHSSLIRGAIVHDWFYRKTCDFTREETDLILYHILVNDGVSRIRASIMFYAVRWFGWNYYNVENCEKEFRTLDRKKESFRIQTLYAYTEKMNYPRI